MTCGCRSWISLNAWSIGPCSIASSMMPSSIVCAGAFFALDTVEGVAPAVVAEVTAESATAASATAPPALRAGFLMGGYLPRWLSIPGAEFDAPASHPSRGSGPPGPVEHNPYGTRTSASAGWDSNPDPRSYELLGSGF